MAGRRPMMVGGVVVVLAVLFIRLDPDPGVPDESPRDEEIERTSDAADTACRGGHGDETSTWQACDVRQALVVDLQERGRCLDDEERWGRCPAEHDDRDDIEDCPATAGTEELFVVGVSCSEASEIVVEAGAVLTTPASVDRFTCIASSVARPRTVWCGDYGTDLAAEETTPGAIVWRMSS